MKRDTIDPGLLRLLVCVPFILLSIVLIAFQAGEEDSKTLRPTQIPSVEVKGTTYVITSVFEGVSECPEGFAHAGEIAVSGSDTLKPYYINPDRPEWVYIYQECRDRQTQEPYMGYVRYVEEILLWATLLRYQGEVYIFLNDTYYLPDQTEVSPSDQTRYDAVPYDSVLQELPEGFQPVGETVFDGDDLVPTSEFGCNRLPGQQVLVDPKEPDILLLRNYSSGLEGPEYWVFVRFQDEKPKALEWEAPGETVLLSGLISSGVSSVKVNGQGKTVELNESELAEFFEITKGIDYRIAGEEEKDLMAAPGAATVTITVQYSDGESEQFTLPYCLHEDTMYIAPAQSIASFSRYLTGSPVRVP